MKKLSVFVMMLCLALCVVGCGSAAKSSNASSAKAQPAVSTEKKAAAPANTKAQAAEMVVKITAGDHVITAKLADNAASKALWQKLPLKLKMMNLYGREMCYRFGPGTLPTKEATDKGYAIGDISYWPPAGSLVILYRQNGEVFEQQPIGHTNDDVSFFKDMPDTEITFAKAK